MAKIIWKKDPRSGEALEWGRLPQAEEIQAVRLSRLVTEIRTIQGEWMALPNVGRISIPVTVMLEELGNLLDLAGGIETAEPWAGLPRVEHIV